MSKENPEIKLALTKEGFNGDVRKVVKALKERNVNRVALITKLWESWKKNQQKEIRRSVPRFSRCKRKEVASMLLERLEEEKEGKDIAAVLAVCNFVMDHDGAMWVSLTERGLAVRLVEILDLRRYDADVVEKGLFAAKHTALFEGKECVECRCACTRIHSSQHFISFRLLSLADASELIRLGIISILENSIEYHSKNHDVMWAASFTCWGLINWGWL